MGSYRWRIRRAALVMNERSAKIRQNTEALALIGPGLAGDAGPALLAAEDALLILVDAKGLVLMLKEKVDYRRLMTEQLRGGFSAERFVPSV